MLATLPGSPSVGFFCIEKALPGTSRCTDQILQAAASISFTNDGDQAGGDNLGMAIHLPRYQVYRDFQPVADRQKFFDAGIVILFHAASLSDDGGGARPKAGRS